MKPILLAGASLAAVLTLSLSGCASLGATDLNGNQAGTTSTSTAPDLPSGFIDLGNGLAAKPDQDHTEDCDTDLGSCWVLDVYAYANCDVYASANGLDGDGAIVDYTNATADSMTPGDTARLTLQFTQIVDKWKVTAINCN